MKIRISMDGEHAEEELRSLLAWLRDEPDVHRQTELSLHSESPAQGEMGSALEVLQLVTDNAWSATAFVLAFQQWRQTRPRTPRTTIERGGTSIVVEGNDADEVARIVDALERG